MDRWGPDCLSGTFRPCRGHAPGGTSAGASCNDRYQQKAGEEKPPFKISSSANRPSGQLEEPRVARYPERSAACPAVSLPSPEPNVPPSPARPASLRTEPPATMVPIRPVQIVRPVETHHY